MDPLDVQIPEEETMRREQRYNDALGDRRMNPQIAFEYAWCLIKSRNAMDIKKGISILNNLCRENDDKRDYMFYLAMGYYYINNYQKAIDLLDVLLRSEPTNTQVLSLREKIVKKRRDDNIENGVIAGGSVLAIGGLLYAGLKIAGSLKRQ